MNAVEYINHDQNSFLKNGVHNLLKMLASGNLKMTSKEFDLEIESFIRESMRLKLFSNNNLFKQIIAARNEFVRSDPNNIVFPCLNKIIRELSKKATQLPDFCDTSFLFQERVTLAVCRKNITNKKIQTVHVKEMHHFDETLRRYFESKNPKKRFRLIRKLENIGSFLVQSSVMSTTILVESINTMQKKYMRTSYSFDQCKDLQNYRNTLKNFTQRAAAPNSPNQQTVPQPSVI